MKDSGVLRDRSAPGLRDVARLFHGAKRELRDHRQGLVPLGRIEQPLHVGRTHAVLPSLERQPHGTREGLEPFDLERIGILVDPEQRWHTLVREPGRHGLVGRQHELLDHRVGAIAWLDPDPGHRSFDVQKDRRCRQVEVDAPARATARFEEPA
jgi:hypothetical protein